MNWSGKMWALQAEDGTLVMSIGKNPLLFITRAGARDEKGMEFPAAKVVRVQVDVKVIE